MNSDPVRKSSRKALDQTFSGIAGSHTFAEQQSRWPGAMASAFSLLMLLAIFTVSNPAHANDDNRLSLWNEARDPVSSSEIDSAYAGPSVLDSVLAVDHGMNETRKQPSLYPVVELPKLDFSISQNPEDEGADDNWQQMVSDHLYFKFTDSLQFDDEAPDDQIPLDGSIEEPEMVPTVGLRNDFFAAEFNEDGFAAGMIQIGVQF